MNSVLVQKYGGMSVATPELLKRAAQKIALHRQSGLSVIVVISAMGKTTDDLTRQAYQICARPNRRELDMLLTTGERVSMALLSMALNEIGLSAISFTGSQAGIMTSGPHSDASIALIKPFRVEEELKKGKIVVLAGYQGVDPHTKEVTTLGRGGSDTTAVAMAAHFRAIDCQIMKEVDGVMSGDPHHVPTARVIPEIDFDTMIDMCDGGAKVLHKKSIELAKKLDVSVSVGSAETQRLGSRIKNRGDTKGLHAGQLLAVNCIHRLSQVTVEGKNLEVARRLFVEKIQAAELPEPRIWEENFDSGRAIFTLSAPEEILISMEELFDHQKRAAPDLSLVSLSFVDHLNEAIWQRAQKLLSDRRCEIKKIYKQKQSIVFAMESGKTVEAVEHLHNNVVLLDKLP